LSFHDSKAKELAELYNGHSIAARLKLPFLVPVFPRPEAQWELYAHQLNRATMLVPDGDMKRVDLRLIVMIRDAQNMLAQNDIAVKDKVLMNGFSASGCFALRFAIMHPDMVRAVAAGGFSSAPTLPTDKVDGTDVRYPVGISDIKEEFGIDFNPDEYKKVSQYIFMGDKDDNDATLYRDSYEQEDADLIHGIIGRDMAARWQKSQTVYRQLGIPAQLVTYKGTGHEVPGYVWNDLYKFFEVNSGDGIVEIEHHE